MMRLPDVPADRRIRLMEQVLKDHGAELHKRAIVTVRGGRIRVSGVPDRQQGLGFPRAQLAERLSPEGRLDQAW